MLVNFRYGFEVRTVGLGLVNVARTCTLRFLMKPKLRITNVGIMDKDAKEEKLRIPFSQVCRERTMQWHGFKRKSHERPCFVARDFDVLRGFDRRPLFTAPK